MMRTAFTLQTNNFLGEIIRKELVLFSIVCMHGIPAFGNRQPIQAIVSAFLKTENLFTWRFL